MVFRGRRWCLMPRLIGGTCVPGHAVAGRHGGDEAAQSIDRIGRQPSGIAGCAQAAAQYPAHVLQRRQACVQLQGREQAGRIACVGQHHVAGLGQQAAIACQQLPLPVQTLQRMHLCVSKEVDARHAEPRLHKSGWLDPGCLCVPQGRHVRHARAPGFGPFGIRGGREFLSRIGPGCRQAGAAIHPQLQHAAGCPVLAGAQQALRLLPHQAQARARQARPGAVIGGHMGHQQTGGQTRGTRRRRGRGVQHLDLPAATHQCCCHARAGQAGTDDHAVAWRHRTRTQGLAAGPELPAGVVTCMVRLQDKTAFGQQLGERRRGRVEGHTGTTAATTRQGLEGPAIPGLGRIEKNAVGFELLFAQQGLQGTDAQRQL